METPRTRTLSIPLTPPQRRFVAEAASLVHATARGLARRYANLGMAELEAAGRDGLVEAAQRSYETGSDDGDQDDGEQAALSELDLLARAPPLHGGPPTEHHLGYPGAMGTLAPARAGAWAVSIALLLACGTSVETAPAPFPVLHEDDPFCPNGQGLQQGAPWPMDGACPNRAYRSRTIGPASPQIRWVTTVPGKYGAGARIGYPPIVAADGSILVTTDYLLSAIAPDATVKWSFEVDEGDAIAGAPAIASSNDIYLVGVAKLYAIDAHAQARWTYAYPDYGGGNNLGGFGSAAIGPDGTIYVPTVPALLAVSPGGAARWRVPFPNQLLTSPVIGADGAVYVWDEGLHAFDPATGEHRWAFAPGDEGKPFALMMTQTTDRRLYLPSQGGNLWVLDPTGAVVRHDTLQDGCLWVVGDGDSDIRLGLGGVPGSIESRDALGATLWSSTITATRPNGILDRNGTLYALGDGIVAIAASGSVLWSLPLTTSLEDSWTGAALGADSTLYATLGGKLLAIGP